MILYLRKARLVLIADAEEVVAVYVMVLVLEVVVDAVDVLEIAGRLVRINVLLDALEIVVLDVVGVRDVPVVRQDVQAVEVALVNVLDAVVLVMRHVKANVLHVLHIVAEDVQVHVTVDALLAVADVGTVEVPVLEVVALAVLDVTDALDVVLDVQLAVRDVLDVSDAVVDVPSIVQDATLNVMDVLDAMDVLVVLVAHLGAMDVLDVLDVGQAVQAVVMDVLVIALVHVMDVLAAVLDRVLDHAEVPVDRLVRQHVKGVHHRVPLRVLDAGDVHLHVLQTVLQHVELHVVGNVTEVQLHLYILIS